MVCAGGGRIHSGPAREDGKSISLPAMPPPSVLLTTVRLVGHSIKLTSFRFRFQAGNEKCTRCCVLLCMSSRHYGIRSHASVAVGMRITFFYILTGV